MKKKSHDKGADASVSITNQRKRAPSHIPSHGRMAKRSCDSPAPGKITTGASFWTEQIHRQFVETILTYGMRQASPSVILEHMTITHEALSSERVKSRLQKYRRKGDNSKSEFMQEYDSWMQTALTMGATTTASPSTITEMMGLDDRNHLLGGHAAAFLSFADMVEEHRTVQPILMQLPPDMSPSKDFVGARIPNPALTPQERGSPLGASIMRVVALCRSMTQNLLEQREATKQEATTALKFTLLEGEHADAVVARAASTDFSLDSSVLSNLQQFTSSILPADDSTEPHQYERKMPANITEATDAYGAIAISNNDATFLAGTP